MMILRQSFGALAMGLVCLLLVAAPRAASAETPASFIERLGGDALGALQNSELTSDQRMEAFQAVLDAGFDIDAMGRFVLARYWRTASKPEREEYMVLFRERVVQIFAGRLGMFSGEDFKVTDSRQQSADITVVESTLTLLPLPPIRVDWHVRGQEPDFKVIDVVVQGLSETQTQRNSFSNAIQCLPDGLVGLLAQLRESPTATPACPN